MSFFRPYWIKVLLLISFIIVLALIELVIPKFIQYFIDVIIPKKDMVSFVKCLIGIILLLGIMLALNLCRNIIQVRVQERVAKDFERNVMNRIQNFGFTYFEQNPVGKILSIFNTEVLKIKDIYRFYLPLFIEEFIFSVIALVFMISVSIRLTLIILPCFLIYYFIGPIIEKRAIVYSGKWVEARTNYNQKVYDSLSGLLTIKANSCEEWNLNQLSNLLKTFNKFNMLTVIMSYLRGSVRRISYYFGGVALFIYGVMLVKEGSLTVGGFVVFLLYFFNTMHRLTSVLTVVTEQRTIIYQISPLYKLINENIQAIGKKNYKELNHVKGEICFQNVSFNYENRVGTIKNLNLEIKSGERVAIVGKSGSGKSTILKLMAHFYTPTEGEILLDGVPMNELSIKQLRDEIGFVFQETFLFGKTIFENIKFGNPTATEEEVIKSAKAAYAHDFIMELPDRYNTFVGERGVRLSGGQRQRIAIARLFIKNPTIILLDEATASLDNISEDAVQKALNSLLKGRTTITIAHRLSTIKDYDRIVVVNEGEIVESGDYFSLIKLGGEFYQMVNEKRLEEIV
ncbi:ABC transporter ATP-binding protein [Bacillus cereus]|nr:ABC transporter ATP-binding protein [Bacillus cereus]